MWLETMPPESDRHCQKPMPDSIDMDGTSSHARPPRWAAVANGDSTIASDGLQTPLEDASCPCTYFFHTDIDVSRHFLRASNSFLLPPLRHLIIHKFPFL